MKFPQGFLMKRNLKGQAPREEVDDKVSNNLDPLNAPV
jgi:hypothetical protein